MRGWLIAIVFLIPMVSTAQKEVKLKKKYFGKYKGTIPAYSYDTGEELVPVSSSAIYVLLVKDEIQVTIGNNELHGTYEVMFEAKKYYLVDAKMDGQLATERIIVYKRGKKLSRDGMYPQPVASLKKY